MNNQVLLETPIEQLPVSKAFKEAMGRQDIKTLEEIVNIPVTDLVNLKWLTEEFFDELSQLLFSGKKL